MKASPLRFVDLKFLRVRVEADFSSGPVEAKGFDFDGAMLSWSLDHGFEEDAKRWWVAVGFATGEAEGHPRCPYAIDVQAVGFFEVSETVPEERIETLVFENGAALVFGSIRDIVSTITGRSLPGPLMLPTPTFVDALKKHTARHADLQGERPRETEPSHTPADSKRGDE